MIKKSRKNTKITLATAAALLVGCSSNADTVSADQSALDMGQCLGVNSCKGSGSCASPANNCASQNSCKGKGWLALNKQECSDRKGKFRGFKK